MSFGPKLHEPRVVKDLVWKQVVGSNLYWRLGYHVHEDIAPPRIHSRIPEWVAGKEEVRR